MPGPAESPCHDWTVPSTRTAVRGFALGAAAWPGAPVWRELRGWLGGQRAVEDDVEGGLEALVERLAGVAVPVANQLMVVS